MSIVRSMFLSGSGPMSKGPFAAGAVERKSGNSSAAIHVATRWISPSFVVTNPEPSTTGVRELRIGFDHHFPRMDASSLWALGP